MAVPSYSINGGAQVHGVKSVWQRQVLRLNTDGSIDHSPSAVNIWTMDKMDMTTWQTLLAAALGSLTSLETNDIDNRNTGKTYSNNVFFEQLTGSQQGQKMINVTCRFRLDI